MARHGCESSRCHNDSHCLGVGASDGCLGLAVDDVGSGRETSVVIAFAEDLLKLVCLVLKIEAGGLHPFAILDCAVATLVLRGALSKRSATRWHMAAPTVPSSRASLPGIVVTDSAARQVSPCVSIDAEANSQTSCFGKPRIDSSNPV